MNYGILGIGDSVIYNGELEYACKYTQTLMIDNLEVGRSYNIKDMEIERSGDIYYQVKDNGYWYPAECFYIDNKYLAEKYNLI